MVWAKAQGQGSLCHVKGCPTMAGASALGNRGGGQLELKSRWELTG